MQAKKLCFIVIHAKLLVFAWNAFYKDYTRIMKLRMSKNHTQLLEQLKYL